MTKFSSLLAVLLLMLVSFTANSQDYPRGDVSQDGNVSISDVTCLIDYLLSGTWPDEPVSPPDDHEWVDLGLPSGTIWATCNVGANAPEEYGDYFAWGETEPKEVYSENTYKWYYRYIGYLHITKYNTVSGFGAVDNKTELDLEDDAAYAHYYNGRMPSLEQIDELCNSCTWQQIIRNGVIGELITGPNGNTMFLPNAGYRGQDPLSPHTDYVANWSRTLKTDSPQFAYILFSTELKLNTGFSSRWDFRAVSQESL